jgi:hypothetical protein
VKNLTLRLRTNCLLEFVHRPDKIMKYNIKLRRFESWFVFLLQVMGGETHTEMGPKSNAYSTVIFCWHILASGIHTYVVLMAEVMQWLRLAQSKRTQLSRCLLSHHLKTEEEPASETSWFLYYISIFYQDDGQSPEENSFSMLHTVVRTC